MKAKLLFLFISIASCTYAHDYFFAFAEVEYNDVSQRIEATLIVSTHDLESALRREHPSFQSSFNDISTITKENKANKIIEQYLLEHFKISSNSNCSLTMIGFEVQLNGLTNFYFESSPFQLEKKIVFTFDLLMNQFELQQNKVTFLYQGKTYTRPFLKEETVQIINL